MSTKGLCYALDVLDPRLTLLASALSLSGIVAIDKLHEHRLGLRA